MSAALTMPPQAEPSESSRIGDATYSPEDNKIRIRPFARLDAATYERVKAAGFAWAPRQELFVAPMWTPARADLAAALCGDLGDEDTSLVDRAEDRAERFGEYSDKRLADAHAAERAVAAIADGIPFGQPILVGHHSERHARKDAERIESGMRKAVRMWETSSYWTARAAGAIRHAKHKELPGVRARRIKGLEADRRKHLKETATADMFAKLWSRPGLMLADALEIANHDHVGAPDGSWSLWSMLEQGKIAVADAAAHALRCHAGGNRHRARWLAHVDLRLAYERAMLQESGGLAGAGFDYRPGGRVLADGAWYPVVKANRSGGAVTSVSVLGHSWRRAVPVEMIADYRPPAEGDGAKIRAATTLGPIVNVPPADGEKAITMVKANWDACVRSGSGCARKIAATPEHGAYRERQGMRGGTFARVYISDLKATPIPNPAGEPVKVAPVPDAASPRPARRPRPPKATVFDAMKESLRAGVQVVTAPQLFPTPRDLAARLVREAAIGELHSILEPSAGTGHILEALPSGLAPGQLVAVEINATLADGLERAFPDALICCADFLTWEPGRTFDRIVMNPPFGHGADIQHIARAAGLLAPGGRLVALCAGGPRQREKLGALAEASGGTWEDLPEGTFAAQGTDVRVALIVIEGAR